MAVRAMPLAEASYAMRGGKVRLRQPGRRQGAGYIPLNVHLLHLVFNVHLLHLVFTFTWRGPPKGRSACTKPIIVCMASVTISLIPRSPCSGASFCALFCFAGRSIMNSVTSTIKHVLVELITKPRLLNTPARLECSASLNSIPLTQLRFNY